VYYRVYEKREWRVLVGENPAQFEVTTCTYVDGRNLSNSVARREWVPADPLPRLP
jgi:hypothetical protein